MNASAAVKLLKEIGLSRLVGFEGCICGTCSIQGVTIDVSCRKSTGSSGSCTLIRVHSRHMDVKPSELEKVAQEVVNQIHMIERLVPIKVRFCDYDDDHEPKCVYCAKPREDVDGYLCDACLTRSDPFGDTIAGTYDFRRIQIDFPPIVERGY
jgi:hypothetical protein